MQDNGELFRSYLDDSEDPATGTYAVGGFVGEAAEWQKLEGRWASLLPAGISFFHTTDCFAGQKEFSGLSVSARTALLGRLTEAIVARKVWLIGQGIDNRTYASLAKKPKEDPFLRNKYAAALGGAVQLACECMGHTPSPEEIWDVINEGEDWEQCAFVMEQSGRYGPSARRTIEDIRNDSRLWFRNRVGSDTFGTKTGPSGIVLLQVGDLGAYLAAKHIAGSPAGRIPWRPFYDKLSSARRVYRTANADARSLRALFGMLQELKRESSETADPGKGI